MTKTPAAIPGCPFAHAEVGSLENPAEIAAWTIWPSAEIQVGHAWPSTALSGGIARVDHLLVVVRARY